MTKGYYRLLDGEFYDSHETPLENKKTYSLRKWFPKLNGNYNKLFSSFLNQISLIFYEILLGKEFIFRLRTIVVITGQKFKNT